MHPWFEELEQHLQVAGRGRRTQREYALCVRSLARWADVEVDALEERHLFAYLAHGRDALRRSPSWLAVNVAAFRYLFGRVALRPHVVARLPTPRVPWVRPRVLYRAEVGALLAAAPTPTARAMIAVGYGGGLRIGEVAALHRDDLDVRGRLLHVARGKGGRPRIVPLGRVVEALLAEQLGATRSPWVFPGRSGRHLTTETIGHQFRSARDRVGLDARRGRVTFHSLRHAFATHALEDGMDVFTLQRVLGHTSIVLTARYVHLDAAHVAAAASPLDRWYGRPAAPARQSADNRD